MTKTNHNKKRQIEAKLETKVMELQASDRIYCVHDGRLRHSATSSVLTNGELDEAAKRWNEHALLQRVAGAAERLRLCINPLLIELPDKSVVNGESNALFRSKIAAIQQEAQTALHILAQHRKDKP